MVIYVASVILINIYCLIQLWLFLKGRGNNNQNSAPIPLDWPFVTVQLPVYNEKYVIERLIDNIVLLDYPGDKLEIQLLDDSTDETSELIRQKVLQYKNMGIQLSHIQRNDRSGFKAGALKAGMETAKGKFIAIFDADFLPRPDFLRRTIPHFSDSRIGVVQTRWEHINADYSWMTMMQAMQLNVHFMAEQSGRQSAGLFLQFNGTGGVWRKETILDAGNWEADTLTEDLDLSYRAQIKGWRIQYLQNIGTPSELPVEMNGLKAQQFRWMKGGAETAKKIIPLLFKSSHPLRIKLHSAIHLLNSSVFLILTSCMISSLFMTSATSILGISINFLAWLPLGLLSLFVVYYSCNQQILNSKHSVLRVLSFIPYFLSFLALSSGLSYHNARAVCLGYIGKKTSFVRTPKFNILNKEDRINQKSYFQSTAGIVLSFEIFITAVLLYSMIHQVSNGEFYFLYFHFMLFLGYIGIIYYTLRDARSK
jgi:cellulose synthase/poly-beta-1,6-N-acetylglucosamine synthase-like glycosyltransferase